MSLSSCFGAGAILLSLLAFMGCSGDEAQKVQPQSRGQRGEACQARNDCQDGLACINGVCSKNDFDLSVSAKHCDRVECQVTGDCCGDKPTEAPAKCAARASVCDTPNLPGCNQVAACTDDGDCDGGVCQPGRCSNSLGMCTSDTQCADTCLSGFCAISFQQCSDRLPCPSGVCQNRACDCSNPDYNRFDPICQDPDCADVCVLKCEDERCVPDNSCEEASDCFRQNLQICDAGRCVECVDDEDCDTGMGESCSPGGRCDKPCESNEECPFFHECQSGECVETGCRSDRECVLAAGEAVASADDARLLKCLPSELDPDIKTCKVPCENDGACGSQLQICDDGYCRFIGCEDNEECRAYLGLAEQMTTPERPFVPKAVCRE
jgi:hypothetical protein